MVRFVPHGQMDPNDAESLGKALGLFENSPSPTMKFHRHYCLGAVR